jgi:hypothetical protein
MTRSKDQTRQEEFKRAAAGVLRDRAAAGTRSRIGGIWQASQAALG